MICIYLLVKLDQNKLTDAIVKQALKQMSNQNDQQEDQPLTISEMVQLPHRDAIQIIDAFDIPQFKFNLERKVFEPVDNSARKSSPIFGDGSDRADVFRERYSLVKQRLLRNDKFNPIRTDSVPVSQNIANLIVFS
jgi:hypothetical protein